MEDWSNDFWVIIETVTGEIEQFFQDISQVTDDIADEFVLTVATEIDQCLQELWEHVLGSSTDLVDTDLVSETETQEFYTPFVRKVEPSSNFYPACVGCHHYHGHIYNGNLLICGMHPYGWEDSNCPDWERENSMTYD